MPTVPRDVLRRLRNDVPVREVINQLRVPTAWCGARRTFRCPRCEGFHTATHRGVNLARCFRCERNFNPIDLVMAVCGWPFLEAVRYLSDLLVPGAGVTSTPGSEQTQNSRRQGRAGRQERPRGPVPENRKGGATDRDDLRLSSGANTRYDMILDKTH